MSGPKKGSSFRELSKCVFGLSVFRVLRVQGLRCCGAQMVAALAST